MKQVGFLAFITVFLIIYVLTLFISVEYIILFLLTFIALNGLAIYQKLSEKDKTEP